MNIYIKRAHKMEKNSALRISFVRQSQVQNPPDRNTVRPL